VSTYDSAWFPCPRCGAASEHGFVASFNADRLVHRVDEILTGAFERVRCGSCGVTFQLEHRMLYAHATAGLWVAMYPCGERIHADEIEPSVRAIFERRLVDVPAFPVPAIRGTVTRVVFGLHALAEAIRAAGVDASALECLKLELLRDHESMLVAAGAGELCYEGEAAHVLRFGLYRLDGIRLGEMTAGRGRLDEIAADHARWRDEYPDLFIGLYVSALRYCDVLAPQPQYG